MRGIRVICCQQEAYADASKVLFSKRLRIMRVRHAASSSIISNNNQQASTPDTDSRQQWGATMLKCVCKAMPLLVQQKHSLDIGQRGRLGCGCGL